jgi:hypothetical protein
MDPATPAGRYHSHPWCSSFAHKAAYKVMATEGCQACGAFTYAGLWIQQHLRAGTIHTRAVAAA